MTRAGAPPLPQTGGRLPPSDAAAESYVLSELMLRPESFDEVSFLLPGCFCTEPNRRIMEAVVDLAAAGSTHDMVAVATWLRDHGYLQRIGGIPYLKRLTDETPTLGNIVQHAHTVLGKWRLREIIRTCQRYAAEGYSTSVGVQEFIEQVEDDVARLAHLDQRVTLELVAEIMAAELPLLRQAQERKGEVLGTSTGYVDLDRRLGGLFDGDLIIIAGRPGMGKTGFATNLALNVAKPVRGPQPVEEEKLPQGVAFFSLEMPRSQIAKRIACSLGRVLGNKLRQNRLSDQDWSRLAGAAVEMQDYPFWVDDQPAITLLELRSRVRKLQREIKARRAGVPCGRLGLVVVDYLQLMRGVREHGDNREREISGLSQGLKNLAKELGVPIVALSQLNRGVERLGKKDKRPTLSDLRESGAIEQDADVVIFLYREHYYDRSKPERDCEAIVAKQRSGPTGIVPLKFESDYLTFYSAEPSHARGGSVPEEDLGFEDGFEE